MPKVFLPLRHKITKHGRAWGGAGTRPHGGKTDQRYLKDDYIFDFIGGSLFDHRGRRQLSLGGGAALLPGRGLTLANGTTKSAHAAVQVPEIQGDASGEPFTLMVEIWPRNYVALAGVFGIQRDNYSEGSPYGENRAILSFQNNYYFWGQSEDWSSGVAFDTDGRRHVVAFVSDGSTLRFYRDGVLRTSTSIPPLKPITADSDNLAFGGGHPGATDHLDIDFGMGIFSRRPYTEAEIRQWWEYSYQHRLPANQSPFIIGVADTLGPPEFDETAQISAAATVTASEVYAPPASDETALVSTAATVTATETFGQAVYDETALISASVALDATGEVYTPPVSNESALVSIATAVNAVEAFTSPAYDETALVSTLTTITSEDAYTAPGDAFFESGRVAIATTVTAAETYTAPAYTETGLVSFSALVEASELYFPPGSFQTAQIVISTTLDAHESWLPPATEQQALISFTGGITAHEIFNTPSALPDGLSAITAIKYGGLKARLVRWDS